MPFALTALCLPLFPQVDAVVFVVDAADRERFAECKEVLHSLLSNDILADAVFLVLGNKTDIPHAAREGELRHGLGLPTDLGPLTMSKSTSLVLDFNSIMPFEIFMCSIVQRTGYREAFTWLSHIVKLFATLKKYRPDYRLR